MAKEKRLYKCWYKNCYKGKVSERDNDFCKIGNKRYHKKCYQDQEDLKKCRELYVEHINPAVVFAQLNKAINTLVLDKKIEPNYLVFVIEYIVDNKLDINAPYGLYYRVNDYKIKEAYETQNIVKKEISSLKIYS